MEADDVQILDRIEEFAKVTLVADGSLLPSKSLLQGVQRRVSTLDYRISVELKLIIPTSARPILIPREAESPGRHLPLHLSFPGHYPGNL